MKAKTANSRRLDIIGNRDCRSEGENLKALLKHWWQQVGYCSIFVGVPAILVANVQASRADEAKKPKASVDGQSVRFLERLNKSCSKPTLLKQQSKFRLPHQTSSYNWLVALSGNDDCPGRPIPGGTYTAAAPYVDTGDTTGANNTITRVHGWYYDYDSAGPDLVYSFVLSGLGPNPLIEVTPTSTTYKPMIYVLPNPHDPPVGACPPGTENVFSNGLVASDSRWSTGSAKIESGWRIRTTTRCANRRLRP